MVRSIALFDFLQHHSNLESKYSLRDEFGKTYEYIIALITLFIAFLIGVIGNFIMIIVSSKLASKRKTIPNKLILYLSSVDLFCVFTVYMPTIIAYIFGKYIGGSLLCNIQASCILFFHNLSILFMLAIAYDRYLAVSSPYYYQDNMIYTGVKATIFILFCCIISSLVSIPPLIAFGENQLTFPGSFCFFDINVKNAVILYLVILSIYYIFMVVGCVGSIITVNNMLEFRKGISATSTNNKEEKMFIRLSIITIVVFVFVWTPVLTLFSIKLTNYKLPDWYITLSLRVAALHSIINPWLYPLLRRKFRLSFASIFQTIFCCCSCGCIALPEKTLDDILNDAPLTERSHQSKSKVKQDEEHAPTIHDYVDAPPKQSRKINDENKFDIEMDMLTVGNDDLPKHDRGK